MFVVSIPFSPKHRCFLGGECNDSTTNRYDFEGKLAKHANSRIGLIEPRYSSSNTARQGFSVARVVVKPENRTVPLRVLNASTSQIELVAGENLADFCPLIESCLPQPHVCGAVGNKATPGIKQHRKLFRIKSSQ